MTETTTFITDEMRQAIGQESDPVVYEVEKGAIKKFALAVGDPNPLWQDEQYAKSSRFQGIIAPPTYCTCFKDMDAVRRYLAMECPLKRVLNGGTEITYFKPIRPGDTISVTTRLVDVAERESRSGKMLFMICQQDFRNAQHEVVASLKLTLIRY